MRIRVLVAAAVLVSAAVHLKLWFGGFRDISVIGPAFLLNAVGGAVIAVLLVTWRHWLPVLLALGFGASTLGAYLISATVGLFGVHEVWNDKWVIIAGVAEIVAIVGALWMLNRELSLRAHGGITERLRQRQATLR